MTLKTLELAALGALLGATAFGADFDTGMKCFESRDFGCAVREWQPLADSGVGQADYNLALLYTRGQGVAKDPVRAAELLEKAANMGIVEAQYNLGQFYLRGVGVSKDDEKAISWFQKAAELGDPNAANNLGTVLENRKDYENALKWYEKAANAGLATAEFNIGEMYDLGQGVEQNFAKANDWYQKAANQGDASSLCNIGILYYNGEGVKLDRERAYTYLLLAFRGGDSRAFELLNFTAEKLDKKQIAKANDEALAWQQTHQIKAASEEVSAPEPIMSADARVAMPQVRSAGLN